MTTVVRGACAVAGAALVISFPLYAQSSAPAADAGIKPAVASSRKFEELPRTEEDGTFFPSHYRQVMKAPLPSLIYKHKELPTVIDQLTFAEGGTGTIAAFQPAGPTTTADNAFFKSLGTNGRTCFTCHQPASGMSISVQHIKDVLRRTGGADPLFAPVDGATCPKNAPAVSTSGAVVDGKYGKGEGKFEEAYETLLERGLIRVFNPIPVNADYSIEVVSDPYGCNTDPEFSTQVDSNHVTRQIISVYRRPRISAGMQFAVSAAPAPATPPATPETGNGSGNIMWDGREPFLEHQVIDATLGHAQATSEPTPDQIKQIVDFEIGIFSAQSRTPTAGELTAHYALGGPVAMASQTPGQRSATPFSLYTTWASPAKLAEHAAMRASVARGEQIFNTRKFVISNDAGINPVPPAPPKNITGACAACHSQHFAGNDSFPSAQQDQGIGGDSAALGGPPPSPFLPVFKVTCKAGAPTGFHGTVIMTNDPGKAIISGKCADTGKFTVPQLRALAPRAPFFSDGSAATLLDVVNFYDKRFSIKLSAAEKKDLVNFLSSL
jgi:cytochrome c peroxidase